MLYADTREALSEQCMARVSGVAQKMKDQVSESANQIEALLVSLEAAVLYHVHSFASESQPSFFFQRLLPPVAK